jgi:asparagine synthase (glutamine-hydrolysing)
MCGIVGAYHLKGKKQFPENILKKMLTVLTHRGPDAEGFYFGHGYSTGVRRLKLRDPAGGVQPMLTSGSVFSLNGELYSYHTDRNRLLSKGIQLKTRSDTEVFFQGLLSENTDFLKNLDGQFALSLYNTETHSLFLARDTFGISPLFYTQTDEWFIFASECKAILASGMFLPKINPVAIDHVLTQLALNPGESCFQNIHSLPPGSFIKITKQGFTLEHFFRHTIQPLEPNNREDKHCLDDKKQIDQLDEILSNSIQRRLEADAEIGLYLSGGVDSSILAAMVAKKIPKNQLDQLTAYSVQLGKTPRSTDESLLAVSTAKYLGIRHLVLPVTPEDMIQNFPRAVFAAEMPVLDHANICLLLLARMVQADGKKAVLTGEGADEAFGGYPWNSIVSIKLLKLFFQVSKLFSSKQSLHKNLQFQNFTQYYLFSGLASIRNLFYSRQWKEEIQDTKSNPFPVTTDNQWKQASLLQRSLVLDYQWLLAGHLLIDKGDRVSMSASIEARYPFLDKRLFEFASQLSDNMKLRGFKNKWILRYLANRYLPTETAWRKKHLFRAEPVIHGKIRPKWVDQLLSPESILATGLFDPVLVSKHLHYRQNSNLFSLQSSFIQVGLSGVVSTQLLHHLFCNQSLCEL